MHEQSLNRVCLIISFFFFKIWTFTIFKNLTKRKCIKSKQTSGHKVFSIYLQNLVNLQNLETFIKITGFIVLRPTIFIIWRFISVIEEGGKIRLVHRTNHSIHFFQIKKMAITISFFLLVVSLNCSTYSSICA